MKLSKLRNKDLYRHRILLDGSRFGMNVTKDTCDIRLTGEEARTLRRAMKVLLERKCAVKHDFEYVATKKRLGSEEYPLKVVLRRHRLNSDIWFLNIDGNSAGHYCGTNVYGNDKAGWQIRGMFLDCIRWLQKESGLEIPKTLIEKVKAGQINLHNLEFAAYTEKTSADLKRLINTWRYMYRAADWKEGGVHTSLCSMLGVKIPDKEEYENSFAVATVKKEKDKSGVWKSRIVAGCRFYDKLSQVGEISQEIAEDLIDRLRVDLWLTNAWMLKNNVTVLVDLERLVDEQHNGSWKNFVIVELTKVMVKSALLYMFQFPNVFDSKCRKSIPKQWFSGVVDEEVKSWAEEAGVNPKISYKAHVAMLAARVYETVEGEDMLLALESPQQFMRLASSLSSKLKDTPLQLLTMATHLLTFDRGLVDEPL